MKPVNSSNPNFLYAWYFLLLLLLPLTYGCVEVITPEPEPEPDPVMAMPLEISGRLEQDSTLTDWREGVDYLVTGNISIWEDVILDIEPGVEIEVKSGLEIIVNGQSAIRARGTEEKPITFRGHETGGFANWKSIVLNSSNTNTAFDHVIIEDAGTEAPCCESRWQDAAVNIQGVAAMTNCTIRNSANIGLALIDQANLLAFENNTFEENGSHGLYAYPNLISGMSPQLATCSFSENEQEFIAVQGGFMRWAGEVYPGPVPYHILGGVEAHDPPLQFKAGCELMFAPNSGLSTTSSGIISIEGTAENPVTMYGESAVVGAWNGLIIRSNNPLNQFNHLDISYAPTAITLWNAGKADIRNTRFQYAECGIFIDTYAELTEENLSFSNVVSDYCE